MKLGLKDRFSIVKGLLYLILGICCVYLIVTGRYLNYIAPRYELLLGISSVALILGGLATVIWAPSRYYKHNWRSIVPIIIPVVLLIVPPVLVPTTGVQGAARINDDKNNFDFTNDAIGEVITVNSESKEPGISKDKKEIVLNSDNFYQTIVKVGSNVDQYKDYTVYMTGYVNRDDNTLKSNEFTISRMAMSCCIADVAPIGMTAHKADGDSLANEQWVSIEGKVSTRDFHGRQQPYVEITKIKSAEPILGYVYP